jgi:hypothetical protein
VQTPQRLKQTEQFRKYLGQVDSNINKIAKDKEVAIWSVYLNPETAQPMELALFIDADAGDPSHIKLLDLTPVPWEWSMGELMSKKHSATLIETIPNPRGWLSYKSLPTGKEYNPWAASFKLMAHLSGEDCQAGPENSLMNVK